MDDLYLLIAEDDADDRFLLQSAFTENQFAERLLFVENGVELMEYLSGLNDPNCLKTLPAIIMIDLNMPKKDGREALREIKQLPFLNSVPVVIFSTTSNEQEMKRCYEMGANSYITKPNSFEGLIKTVAALHNYWLQA